MTLAGWITAAIGTLGVGGTIAIAIFAPTVLPALVKATVSLGRAIISTRVGVGAVCLVIGLAAGDQFGEHRIQAQWTEARAAASAEKARLDNEAAEHAAAEDAEDTAAEATADQSNTEARDAYIKKLEASVCALDADALGRLSNIK